MRGTIYNNGGYQVEVAPDGAIQVRPGDWLSKYALAIYNSKHRVSAFFYPPDDQGNLVEIQNKDLILTGDTVIHEPTWTRWKQNNPGRPGPSRPGDMGIEGFLQRLHDEGGVRGERLDRMSSLLTGTKWRDISEANALKQLGYLSLETFKGWGMLNGSMLLPQALSGVPGFIAVFQMTFQAMVAWLDAQESALRFQGLRAIAYATTAFAFGDPLPCLPYGIEYNLTHGTWRGVVPLNQYRVNWLDVAAKATARLAADLSTRGVNKQVYQTWIRWEANDRRELALRFMEEFARGMSTMLPTDRVMLMSPKPIYPNDC